MVTGAIVAAAFRIAVIDTRIKPFSSGIAELLVPHSAERHAPFRTRLLITQDGVVFFTPNFRALKPDKLVVFRVFNDHTMNEIV